MLCISYSLSAMNFANAEDSLDAYFNDNAEDSLDAYFNEPLSTSPPPVPPKRYIPPTDDFLDEPLIPSTATNQSPIIITCPCRSCPWQMLYQAKDFDTPEHDYAVLQVYHHCQTAHYTKQSTDQILKKLVMLNRQSPKTE